MGKKTGLFGGTFDPVHNGHVSIVQSFLNSPFIDELWVLLTPYPPHKKDKSHTSYPLRMKMLEKAFSSVDSVMISSVERDLPRPSYTIQTLHYLQEKFPDHSFHYCMGEDSLAEFHTWKDYKKILESCRLLVAHRPEADHSEVDGNILRRVNFVDHTPVDISSSEIRTKIQNGKKIEHMVPEGVQSLIEKEHLYR